MYNNNVHITARITFIYVFIRSSNIWLSYILNHLKRNFSFGWYCFEPWSETNEILSQMCSVCVGCLSIGLSFLLKDVSQFDSPFSVTKIRGLCHEPRDHKLWFQIKREILLFSQNVHNLGCTTQSKPSLRHYPTTFATCCVDLTPHVIHTKKQYRLYERKARLGH